MKVDEYTESRYRLAQWLADRLWLLTLVVGGSVFTYMLVAACMEIAS